jgi:hypothetical protein
MELLTRGASVLRVSASSSQPVDDSLRVGVLLPTSVYVSRAEAGDAIGDALCGAVAGAVGHGGVVVESTACKRWTFSQHTGVEMLRKWLGEQSRETLRKAAIGAEWKVESAETMEYNALCSAMVASFVRTQLKADLSAALKHAKDEQIKALLEGWRLVPQGAVREDWITQAVAALDSEKKWGEVEGWVRLYCGRIQGRTRLGLEGLMRREAEKIEQYGLTKGEVLALHLYTGIRPRDHLCGACARLGCGRLRQLGFWQARNLCR